MKKKSTSIKRKSRRSDDPATVYLASLAPSGRRSMRCLLQTVIKLLGSRKLVENFEWQTLQYADMVNVRAKLMDLGRSIHTVNLTLSAMRGVAQSAFHLGLLDAEELLHIKSVKRIPFQPLPSGRSLSEQEVKRLLKSCQRDTRPKGRRDCALIATLITTGLRRAEIVALTLDKYDQKNAQLQVTQTKRHHERLCPLPPITNKALKAWLRKRGAEPGALFCRVTKTEQIVIHPLSTQAVYDIVKNRASDSGIEPISPHDFRRTFVTRLLENNVDINIVRELVGNRDIKTTCRYDRRTPNARQYVEGIISFK